MAEFTEMVHEKCQAFGDRIIKLNDYLLQFEVKKEELRAKKEKRKAIPIFLLSISNICNQLLRAGTSIGANNAEAINAISKNDYRSKSHIALKEARLSCCIETSIWMRKSTNQYMVIARNWFESWFPDVRS